jgi:chromosome partitioning protein
LKSLVFFNNKGGVGKTTLTFNVAHMMARQNLRVVLLDYDPQSNLTSIVLSEEELTEVWEKSKNPGRTVASCLELVRRGKGDVSPPELRPAADNLWILPGDLALSRFEQVIAEAWAKVHGTNNEQSLMVTTALEKLVRLAAERVSADVVLLDVGSSLGALNRGALLACDALVVPLAPDLFSLQGLKNVGPTLVTWREDWKRVLDQPHAATDDEALPDHAAEPLGYVVQQHLARVDKPVSGYSHWADQIPEVFRENVIGKPIPAGERDLDHDPYRIALLKHFASLLPLAQAARKPFFDLRAADGIGGGQIQAVAKARGEFDAMVKELRRRLNRPPIRWSLPLSDGRAR